MMKIEISIDRTKKLPNGAERALQSELSKRLSSQFPEIVISVRRAGCDDVSMFRIRESERELVEKVLRETWENVDEWFYEH